MPCIASIFAYSRPCSAPLGGIRAVYIADPTAVNIDDIDTASGEIQYGPKVVGAKPFYKWEVAENSASLESTSQISEANNTAFFQHVLTAALQGFDATDDNADIIGVSGRAVVVYELRDGSLWTLYGDPAGITSARLTVLNLTTGVQRSDRQGATVSFQADSVYLPLQVDAITFSAIINS